MGKPIGSLGILRRFACQLFVPCRLHRSERRDVVDRRGVSKGEPYRRMSMHKILGVALAACLVVGTLVAPAAGRRPKKHERTVTVEYQAPAIKAEIDGSGGEARACFTGGSIGEIGCTNIPVRPTEKYLDLEVTDASGLPVPIDMIQDVRGPKRYTPLCGGTEKPIRIVPGVAVFLWFVPYRFEPLCLGTATRGTVTATLSNRR